MTLVNEGLPGNNVADCKLMLGLMCSARLISYGFIGGYEPGVGSDTGLGIRQKYNWNYAVMPHGGDWKSAVPWRTGLEFSNLLLARTAFSQPGPLSSQWGIVSVSGDNVVVSALKQGKEGSVVLRVYEAAGKAAPNVRAVARTHKWRLSHTLYQE